MASPATRDQFLRQMEQIVEGIKQSRMKVRWLFSYNAAWISYWFRKRPWEGRPLLVDLGMCSRS